MTKIKLCGLSRAEDIAIANELRPEFIGFVFARKSRRYISPKTAAELKKILRPEISAVGVFVDENISAIAELLGADIIDAAQLHGSEDETYIKNLRGLTSKPIIQAFKVENLARAEKSSADFVLIDAGAGDGKVFDWRVLENFQREYFLAGGLNPENVSAAIKFLRPLAVDVSSGIETNGRKDADKMRKFVLAARGATL